MEEEARLTAALEALEEGGGDGQAGRGGDSRDHSRMYGVQRINRAAMKHNTLMSFRGVTARPDGGDKGGGGGTSAADPFSRRATGNKVYWKAGNAAAAKARADAEAAAAAKELEVQKALMRESVAHAALTSAQSRMDPVELLRQVDLHIDDSLLQEEAAAAAAAQHGGSGLAMARKLLGRAWLSRGGGAAAGSALPPELAGGSVLSLDEYLSTRRTGMLFGQ